MAEEVNTGGNTIIRYSKGYKPEINEERDRELQRIVDEGYAKARKRKIRNKILIAMGIIIILAMGYFLLR